jgi:hypothetical protein
MFSENLPKESTPSVSASWNKSPAPFDGKLASNSSQNLEFGTFLSSVREGCSRDYQKRFSPIFLAPAPELWRN